MSSVRRTVLSPRETAVELAYRFPRDGSRDVGRWKGVARMSRGFGETESVREPRPPLYVDAPPLPRADGLPLYDNVPRTSPGNCRFCQILAALAATRRAIVPDR